MTHRRRLLRSTLALGVLVGAGLLTWLTVDRDRGLTVPARPQMAAIHVTVDRPEAEPLPRIQVPELIPQPPPDPGRTGSGVYIPPRPRPVLAAFFIPEYTEDLPSITVPELRRPLAPRPRTSTA